MPVRRSRLVISIIYGLVIAGLATLHGQLMIFAIPFLLYLAAGLLFRPTELQIAVSRKLSADRVPLGTPVNVTLTVTNEGPRLENVLLEDITPRGLEITEGETRTLTRLETGQTIEMEYTISGQRGYYQLPGIRATARDHLGIFKKQIDVQLQTHLFILPQVYRLPMVAIRPRRTRVYSGLIPARKGGPGVEFFGVREYEPGDSPRWINHRASARFEQTLFVNQYEQERAVDVGLILDTRLVTNLYANSHSLLEHTVRATATLADAFLNRGNRVGLFIYGGSVDWTFPGYGKYQRERILQALARARLQQSQIFEKLGFLPTRLFPIRSQLVLVSPLRPQDLDDLIRLRARGYQLLIISPDPIDFERKILGDDPNVALAARIARLERSHLFHQLGQAGARTFEWQVDTPFHRTARYALSRLPLWSRGPHGR